jgi:hypothetical protein
VSDRLSSTVDHVFIRDEELAKMVQASSFLWLLSSSFFCSANEDSPLCKFPLEIALLPQPFVGARPLSSPKNKDNADII